MKPGKKTNYKVGDVFHLLTIKKLWTEKSKPNKSKESWCEAECKCGNVIKTPLRYIVNGHKKSCNCIRWKPNSTHPSWKGCGKISGSIWRNIKDGAKRKSRNIPFEITIKQAWQLFEQQKGKCALSGVNIHFSKTNRRYGQSNTASLDRIDSKRGYTIDNIQWVHKIVNNMKQCLTNKHFKEWCKLIGKYNVPLESNSH